MKKDDSEAQGRMVHGEIRTEVSIKTKRLRAAAAMTTSFCFPFKHMVCRIENSRSVFRRIGLWGKSPGLSGASLTLHSKMICSFIVMVIICVHGAAW